MGRELRKSRTGFNFEEHELEINNLGECIIYKFAKPDLFCHSVTFINIAGHLVVTGDWGHYVFKREFRPDAEGYVSDDYWCSKLNHYNEKHWGEYSSEETYQLLQELIADYKTDNDIKDEDEDDDEYIFAAKDLQRYTYSEYAYLNQLENEDLEPLYHEDIMPCYSIKKKLLYIFDAFEAICERLYILEKKDKK
ncbi:MAG: hypothetical protein KKC80_08710 [Candidatus Margulisbacteria bacterium]|nr:hypothetical protein [Candidatus Margulisiibacteriota bacterium]